MPALRFVFRTLQRVAPARAARWAEVLFFTPPRTRVTPEGRALLEEARPFSVRVDGSRLAAWSWGDGPIVYLVHGWGSRGGRLAAFVPPLVDAGFQVVTHDAPGHGASDGRLSSMPEFARALRGVVEAVGEMHGVIAHSLGASASTLAMHWGLRVPRAVFLAPAADPPGFAFRFGEETLGLDAATVALVRENSERRLGVQWSDLQVPPMAQTLDVPLLVIHDRDDAVVPWADGSEIVAAWPGASLVTTMGLGHRNIVCAPEVIARAVGFLAGGPAAKPAKTAARFHDAHWIEQHLFFREARMQAALPTLA